MKLEGYETGALKSKDSLLKMKNDLQAALYIENFNPTEKSKGEHVAGWVKDNAELFSKAIEECQAENPGLAEMWVDDTNMEEQIVVQQNIIRLVKDRMTDIANRRESPGHPEVSDMAA